MADRPLTVAVGFDGVIHSYTSGWTGVLDISDPPVEGAIDWLDELAMDPGVEVIIHSCRFTLEPEEGWYWEDVPLNRRITALHEWLHLHGLSWDAIGRLRVWACKGKPHAHVYIDDRGWRFAGRFPALTELRELQPWNRGPQPSSTGAAEQSQHVHRSTWAAFRRAGLLWWVNRALHLFGWAIAVEVEYTWYDPAEKVPEPDTWVRFETVDGTGWGHGKLTVLEGWSDLEAHQGEAFQGKPWRWRYMDEEQIRAVYPVRSDFRGFAREAEEEGFSQLTEHMAAEAPALHAYMRDRAG